MAKHARRVLLACGILAGAWLALLVVMIKTLDGICDDVDYG